MKATDLVDRSDDRRLRHHRGDLYLWDIDKTYLDTHFSSVRGLLRIPLELAVDKVSIAGSVPLLRALRRGPTPGGEPPPLYFISGSPKQLRRSVERKMTLDGVGFDGITFKDQWGLLRSGRIADLRTQVGYKLMALLGYAREFDDQADWWMFGDDVEQDAEVFLLFGRILAGFRGRELREELERRGVHRLDREEVLNLATVMPVRPADPVQRIFILAHRDPNAVPEDDRVVVMPTFLTGALELAQAGRVSSEAVSAVAKDLRSRGVAETRLEASVRAAEHRLSLSQELIAATGVAPRDG